MLAQTLNCINFFIVAQCSSLITHNNSWPNNLNPKPPSKTWIIVLTRINQNQLVFAWLLESITKQPQIASENASDSLPTTTSAYSLWGCNTRSPRCCAMMPNSQYTAAWHGTRPSRSAGSNVTTYHGRGLYLQYLVAITRRSFSKKCRYDDDRVRYLFRRYGSRGSFSYSRWLLLVECDLTSRG